MVYISLGSNCSITYQLSKFGLRKQAYPFDWVKITISQLIQILNEDFHDYSESLEFVSISENHPIINCNANCLEYPSSLILTNKYKIKFAHELGEKYQLDEFKNTMTERINRFKVLTNDKDICFIRIELTPLNKSWQTNILRLSDLLYKYSSNFKLILIICSEIEFEFPSNIIIHRFDKFVPDWKMDTINWNEILNCH